MNEWLITEQVFVGPCDKHSITNISVFTESFSLNMDQFLFFYVMLAVLISPYLCLQVLGMYPEFCEYFWSNLEITFNLRDVCYSTAPLFIETKWKL